ETQGIVLLEAMASGLPVIGAKAGAIPELVREGNGFLFTPGNSEELAGRMEDLIGDESLRKRMGRESLDLAGKHSLESIRRKITGLYKELLSEDYEALQKRDRGDW
ncbi:MAG: glycosyltransferase family 4 protein, partial [Candidatus Aenigmarchaeota archaeon]|nr:glycosyltransferase family 4 protein [Candidatus Aenigmarchaeota archaeon]